MATVRDLLARKKTHPTAQSAEQGAEAHGAAGAPSVPTGSPQAGVGRVVSVPAAATVLDAARLMTERGIGGLIAVDGAGQMVGIFTERDVLRRVVNAGLDPRTTTVRDVMTAPVLTVSPDTTGEECRRLFTERRIRHLPVVGPEGLCGVVTSGDLLAFEADEARATIEHLEGYVFSNR